MDNSSGNIKTESWAEAMWHADLGGQKDDNRQGCTLAHVIPARERRPDGADGRRRPSWRHFFNLPDDRNIRSDVRVRTFMYEHE